MRPAAQALTFSILLAVATAGCNPFAPGLEDVKIDRVALLGNRKTVSGFFDWFRNSYEMRGDTSLYGQILGRDFIFSSQDFASGNTIKFDRDQEMSHTTAMFRRIRSVNLVWSWYKTADTSGSDTLARVERYFNLSIQDDELGAFSSTGTARLTLARSDSTQPWRVRDWADISGY